MPSQSPRALQVYAGPRAQAQLRQRGLRPAVQQALVPGWLDKGLRQRQVVQRGGAGAAPRLGAQPARRDFKTWQHDTPGRNRVWQQALAAAQQLADEAADWLASPTQHALAL